MAELILHHSLGVVLAVLTFLFVRSLANFGDKVTEFVSRASVAWFTGQRIVFDDSFQERHREPAQVVSDSIWDDEPPEFYGEVTYIADPRPTSIAMPEQVFLVWDEVDEEFKRLDVKPN